MTEHPLFKSFGKTSDDPIIYTLIVYDETPPSDESSTGNSATPPSQPEPKTPSATSTEPSTEQAPKVSTPDESSTSKTPAQQAAPQSSTRNTPAQQAAAQSSTGNTQGTPRSDTTNTPADTTRTPTPDTPQQQASNLVVEALKVNKDVLDAGESFTISAVVKNQGEGSSETTGTLTYYQYFDDKSVEKVGESEIALLAAGETTDVGITLTAPETSGSHSYYACVSTNCASIVKISVRSEIKELVISSGDNQTGTPNNDLPNPISVQVLDEDGVGVPRVLVIFRVVSGTAHMRRAGGPKRWRGTSAWTDSEGYAKAYVTPADTETIKIRASVDGLDPVVFTVNPEQVGSAPSAQLQSHITALLANYPNPFNPETWIPYRLAKASEVVVVIFASNGQVIRRLHLGHQPADIYQSRSRAAHWDGKNEYGEPVASGVYFYTFTAGDFIATRKMLIMK
ncbi:MAG: T9SS type A sorting domain-containing protein [Candidatus Poribacteria bacterium]|nr:T9SS type A sorting domain-containing protein [Candidatus Poribacteria bacterium]